MVEPNQPLASWPNQPPSCLPGFEKFETELVSVRVIKGMERVRLEQRLKALPAEADQIAADQINITIAEARERAASKATIADGSPIPADMPSADSPGT